MGDYFSAQEHWVKSNGFQLLCRALLCLFLSKLCFLLLELSSFSFLIINGFQNSNSFCLVWDFSYTKIAKKPLLKPLFPPTRSCLMNFEVQLDDMHTIYLGHLNKSQYVLCLQSTSNYRFPWLKYQRFILKPKLYSGRRYFSYKLNCRRETVGSRKV